MHTKYIYVPTHTFTQVGTRASILRMEPTSIDMWRSPPAICGVVRERLGWAAVGDVAHMYLHTMILLLHRDERRSGMQMLNINRGYCSVRTL
jgi:hypothetical protein